MAWLQLSLVVTREQAPLAEALFESLGALSVTFGDAGDSPLLEPPPGSTEIWDSTRVTGLFAGDSDAQDLRSRIAQTLAPEISRSLRLERLEDQAWERAWMDAFHPMQFGQRLWIRPSGRAVDSPEAVVLDLDPGLAFGTGTHPTTALCLRWLDGATLTGSRVLDYGCGSGVLAIAALKLGAAQAVGVDYDPQALEASLDNARKNVVADRLSLHDPDSLPAGPYDLVLANILARTLVELAPRLSTLVRPGCALVLSGMLTEQTTAVRTAYASEMEMAQTLEQDGWALLALRRRAQSGSMKAPAE